MILVDSGAILNVISTLLAAYLQLPATGGESSCKYRKWPGSLLQGMIEYPLSFKGFVSSDMIFIASTQNGYRIWDALDETDRLQGVIIELLVWRRANSGEGYWVHTDWTFQHRHVTQGAGIGRRIVLVNIVRDEAWRGRM